MSTPDLRSESLASLRRRAHAYIERAERPVDVSELAGVLFARPRRTNAVAPLLIRTLLAPDERFCQSRRDSWELASRSYARLPLASARFAVVDLEATGSLPAHDRIIEIAVVRVEGLRMAEEFHSLVAPAMPVPPLIQQLTGIQPGMLRGAPALPDIAPRILEVLDDTIFVAHNAEFDYGFLRAQLSAAGYDPQPAPRVCTLRLARRRLPFLQSCALPAVAAHYGVPHARRHRAVDDARATAGVLLGLIRDLLAEGVSTLGDVLALQAGRA